MADLFLEINDELRTKQIKALWAKYGQAAVTVAVFTVLATAAGVFWHNHMTRNLTLQTDRLLTILEVGEADRLVALVDTTDKPLKTVAHLYAAQAVEADGDKAKAALLYKAAAEQSGDTALRDLAQLHVVRLGLVEGKDAKALLARVDPLIKEDAPFRASALEFKGLILRKLGRREEAAKLFESLSMDGSVPNSIRQRARALREE